MLSRKSKKDLERLYMQRFIEACDSLPHDNLDADREAPDFVLRTANGLLGIELKRLFRPPHPTRGSLRAQESLMYMITNEARKQYETRGLPSVDVHVLFHRSNLRKRDVQRYATAIADLVQRRLPSTIGSYAEFNADDDYAILATLPGVARIHVSRFEFMTENFFAPSFAAWRPVLDVDFLQAAIDTKNAKLPSYDARCDAMWLILAHGLEGLPATMSFADGVGNHVFTSGFDRVFLFGWENDVQELQVKKTDVGGLPKG